MNAKRHELVAALLLVLVSTQIVLAESAAALIRQGNRLYGQGNFNEAVNQYDEALVETPEAIEPKFNKANSYYRLDDLDKAADLYKEVAAEAKDMKLVTKAKYNLGNCYFQQGSKQQDSNLQKAVDDYKTSITHWRSVLDIEPENKKAARNIEVARLIIKDILEQLVDRNVLVLCFFLQIIGPGVGGDDMIDQGAGCRLTPFGQPHPGYHG